MNRLFSLLMLVLFVAQHLVCCCTESAARSCPHKTCATKSVVDVAQHHEKQHPHSCRHKHLPDSDDEHGPGDAPHQHHFCVGTHVFFVAAPRAEITPPTWNCGFRFSVGLLDFSHRNVVASLLARRDRDANAIARLISCPQRSAICVYRI